MSSIENTETTDASELFEDIDFTKPRGNTPADDPKANPFMGVEDKLKLPRGSTQEGIRAAKEEVKRITDEAKGLKTQKEIVERKERLASEDLLPGFDMDTLAHDRAVLRDNYMRLYERGLKVLDRIEEDLANLVNPEPDDYANYQRQYLAMLKSLDSIRAALVTFREEEEKDSARRPAVKGGPEGTAEGTQGAAPGAVEVTPQDTNAWIAKWTAEMEQEKAEEIQKEFDEREKGRILGYSAGKPGETGETPA